jgi:hypothetical protein
MTGTLATTTAEARVATQHAARYMTQLCKHWGHKFEVSYDATHGTIKLPSGLCKLDAGTDALAVRLEAHDAASLPRFQEVVEEHIKRFAFREELAFAWTAAT